MNFQCVRLVIVFMVLSVPLVAQSKRGDAQQKILSQRSQAISIIEQTAVEAALWDDHKSAVEALSSAADLLWKEFPDRSSKWLTRAWELIDQVSESGQDESLREFVRTSPRSPLRSMVLRVAHTHDPKLADKFIEQLTQSQPEERKDRGAFDDRTARSEQFLQLAQQVVNTNPELAFTLAQQSLVDGLSFRLQSVLTSLRKKDVSLSNRLFDLALARFTSRVPDPSEAEILAGYLFQPGVTFSSSADGRVIMSMNPTLNNEPVVAQSEPQRARDFLVAAYQAFLTRPLSLDTPASRSRAQQIWVFGTRNVRRYETAAPEFVVPAKTYLAQLEQQLFPAGRGNPFSRPSPNAPTGERDAYEARIRTLEERAEKATDPKEKSAAYVDAVLAVEAENYTRAKEIAEKISDSALRSETVTYVFYRAALSFAAKNDFDKASELSGKIEDPQRRAVVRIAIVHNMLKSRSDGVGAAEQAKVEEVRAFDLLNEVEKDLRKVEPLPTTARIMLGRSTLLAQIDKQETLRALQQALQIINKLEQFELNDPMAPRFGISISRRSATLVNTPRVGFSFRSAVNPIVQDQFEELAELAGSFRLKEVRGLGRLDVARLFLEKTANLVTLEQ